MILPLRHSHLWEISIRSLLIIKMKMGFFVVLFAPPTHPPRKIFAKELHNPAETPRLRIFTVKFSLCFQSPTQTRLFVLLGTLMLSTSAHADISKEITLHNDDARDELSVVRNWTQICSHLCRFVPDNFPCSATFISYFYQQLESFRSRLRVWLWISGNSSPGAARKSNGRKPRWIQFSLRTSR